VNSPGIANEKRFPDHGESTPIGRTAHPRPDRSRPFRPLL